MATIEMQAFMGPSHSYYEHSGPWFERSFHQESIRQGIKFPNRMYLVGYWTDFLEAKPPGGRKKAKQRYHQTRAAMGDMLAELSRDIQMFTVVQHDDGLFHPWPKNLTVFGAGGVGDVPLPLLMPTVVPDHDERDLHFRVTFMGKAKGPNNRYGVRGAMLDAFNSRPEFGHFPIANYKRYCEIIRRSAFTMCPAGYGLTSFRLYETLALGSVPVYIHNGTPWLPYADKLDWSEMAVLVAPDEIHDLPARLDAIDEPTRQRMRSNVRDVFEEHFTMPGVVRRVKEHLEKHDAS